MTTQPAFIKRQPARVQWNEWAKIGSLAALPAVAAVLVVQAVALAVFPEIALFKPLDSYARTALFVLVPAIAATAIFAWLASRKERPVSKFIILSIVVLLISFIPDFVLPDANRTLLASGVAAFMHLVAGVIIVPLLVLGYRRQIKTN